MAVPPSTPALEGPTQKLHPALFVLEHRGKKFEISFHSGSSRALFCTPKHVV